MSTNGPLVQKLRPRQEMAVRRFTQYCKDNWGSILFHKVGTGKTISSLAIAFNSMTPQQLADDNIKIYIVAPTSTIFGNFKGDLAEKLVKWNKYTDKLVDYPYPNLIRDINNRSMPNMADSLIIFDEAHRLLGNEIYNSMEAGSNVGRHPMIEDIYFIHKIRTTKKCIVMTGTPIQVDVADICRFLNFVSKTDNFTVEKYASVTISQTVKQYAITIWINWLRGAGVDLATKVVGNIKAAPSTTQYLKNKASVVTSIVPATVAAYESQIVPLLAKTSENLNDKFGEGWPYYLMAAIAVLTTLALSYRAYKRKRGGTRRKQKGGGFLDVLKSGLPYLALSAGPTGPGQPLEKALSKFGVDTYIAGLQETMEELYVNQWQVAQLAKDASKYISVYDPELQVKLTDKASLNKNTLASLNLNSLKDDSVKLDMPEKITKLKNIQYDTLQHDLLGKMIASELPYEWKNVFNVNKYDSPTPDVKVKFKFVRQYARMIGNISEHSKLYYTVINEAGTDYQVFERSTGKEVNPLDFFKTGGLFKCEKFKDCLDKLLLLRTSGKLPLSSEDKIGEVSGDTLTPQQEALFMKELEEAIKNPIPQEEIKLPDVQSLQDQAHYGEGRKQYLPLVYSYTEDFGLSYFCMYLKSMGLSYKLLHTKNENLTEDFKEVRNNTFDPLAINNPKNPLCVLLHPTMTEGYDFVYNPAIFVLEPCNTFGDQEQVYGRVLRSYSEQAIQTFGGKPRKKLIYQYQCLTETDNMFIRKAKIVWSKADFRTSRIFLTPQSLFQSLQKAKITSPDAYAIERLAKEEKYLAEFKKAIDGGIDFSNIKESQKCLMANPAVSDMDPMTPPDSITTDPSGIQTPLTNGGRYTRKQRRY